MLVSTTVDRYRKAHAGRAWAGCWAISRGYPTLTVEHMQGLLELCWRQPSIRRFYMTALAFGAGAHSDGGKSSRTSGWSICAKTGCACLFRMIFVISSMKASGLSTKSWAILDETRFALLHFVQDSHSLVFTHSVPILRPPFGLALLFVPEQSVGAECLEEWAVSHLWRRQGGNS